MNLQRDDTPVTRKELERALVEMRSFVLALVSAGEGERTKEFLEDVGMSWEGFENRSGVCEGCGEVRRCAKARGGRWGGEEEAEEREREEEEDESSESSFLEEDASSCSTSSIRSPSSSYPPPIGITNHLDSSPSFPTPIEPSIPATTFLSHVSHPHGSLVEPGSAIVKTWKLRNASTQTLHPHSALRFLFGASLHSYLPLQHVGPVEAGETFEVSVRMKAPSEEGTWKAVWWLDDLEDPEEGGRGRLEVEVCIITGNPSSAYFPSSHFPQTAPSTVELSHSDSTSPPSSPRPSYTQVSYDHLSHSVSNIDLSASVDWSESGRDWDDGCTGDVEVDEGVEDLVVNNLGEDWTEVRWVGEGR